MNNNKVDTKKSLDNLNKKNNNLPLRSRMAKLDVIDEAAIHREIVMKKAEHNRGIVRKRKNQENKS